MGFPYMTDFRIVTDVNFAIKYNGIYLININSTLPKYIEAVIGKKSEYTLISP
jgi:hypothetical protein